MLECASLRVDVTHSFRSVKNVEKNSGWERKTARSIAEVSRGCADHVMFAEGSKGTRPGNEAPAWLSSAVRCRISYQAHVKHVRNAGATCADVAVALAVIASMMSSIA